MPTRLIREGLLDSERYSHLSDQGKLFFIHILLIADDFGCLSLAPAFLRRRIFYNAPSNEFIAKLTCELADADLIRVYEADRQPLAFIPRFGQRLRIRKSKYPLPPPSLYDDDLEAKSKFNDLMQKMPVKCLTDVRQLSDICQPEVEVEVEVEVEKNKNKRSLRTAFVLPDWIPVAQWQAWIDSRQRARKPATDWAKRLAVAKLEELKNLGHHPAAVLSQSAFNSWSGLFPLKEKA